MFIRSICRLATALALAAAPLGGAHADAPYLTDDPDPTDYRQFEIYLYAAGVEDGGANSGTPLGLEINYGALPDVEISASVPAGFIAPASNQPTFAISEAEFGIKYRFIEEDEAGWRPQIGFYPTVQVALGSRGEDHGTHEFLAMWAQKSFGLWTTYGGGGYRVNPGPQGINSWFAGWGIERRLGDRLQLGAEIYHETAEARGEKANSGVNFGAIFDFNDTYHLLGSAGPRTSDCCRGTALAYYLALAWTPGT